MLTIFKRAIQWRSHGCANINTVHLVLLFKSTFYVVLGAESLFSHWLGYGEDWGEKGISKR